MPDQLTIEDIRNKSISELYHQVKLPKEIMDSILKQGDEAFEQLMNEKYPEMICKNCKWWVDNVCKRDEPYEKRDPEDHCPIWERVGRDEIDEKLLGIYRDIMDILKEFCDLNERYYPLIALWILGTYYHNKFPSYPYLYFNAMKGSGKSRILRLITYLSKDGAMLNSLTEAVLFRTKGTLAIDEFEGITRKGSEALRELLNSAYKEGITVKRMKKIKTMVGEEQVVEEFNVYRPILLANINGLDDVLGDRCIQIILDKSNNPKVTKKIEIYKNYTPIKRIKEFPFETCRLCRVDPPPEYLYREWNKYIDHIYTNNTNNYNNINNTYVTMFEKVNKTGIEGRHLELGLPLFILANELGQDVLDNILVIFKEIVDEKRKEDFIESLDVSLIEFISQGLEGKWVSMKDLFNEFKAFVNAEEPWFNEKWLGRALKRLNLVKEKKRMNYGRLVILDVPKAQEKIRMFK